MKLNTKIKLLAVPAATIALAASPIFMATSCSRSYGKSFFTVTTENNLQVEFCDWGASIYGIKKIDKTTGKSTYLTYHPTNKTTFVDPDKTPYYYGKTLGRVAGRFADGKFKIDNKEYTVQVNETSSPKNNCLHGGIDAFSFKKFTRYISVDKANNCQYIAFNYLSPAGEAGFPETVDAWVIYKLYEKTDRLDTFLYAIPSGKTVINLSTHSLFRLGNEGNVLNYTLHIPTTTRAKYAKEDTKKTDQTVEGEVTMEENSPFNFNTAKTIGKDIEAAKAYDPISNGYDHIWTFTNQPTVNQRYVELVNGNIKFKVTALSDKVTGFILYANDYPREGQIMQGDNKKDTQYAGITIEPYTFFTKSDLSPIIYTPDNPFMSAYSYEWTF